MLETNKPINDVNNLINEPQWPGISSHFLLIAVAALRHKQLAHGARPRIVTDARRHRNTSIALEEVRQGLVPFTANHYARRNNEQSG
jgi:DNA-directed RNA polymerase omega subunit